MAKKNHNVLVVAYGRANEMTGYSHRIFEITKSLHEFGHKIVFLWFSPFNKIRPQHHFEEMRKCSKVIIFPTLPLFFLPGIDLIGRWLCSWYIRKTVKNNNITVIHAETALGGRLAVNAATNCSLVVDLHGDVVSELKMLGRPEWCISRCVSDINVSMLHADAIVAVSRGLCDIAVKKSRRATLPVAVLPCAVDVNRFASASIYRSKIRSQLGVDGRFVIVYCGGLDMWQCIPETLDLVARLRKRMPEIFFLFLTNGNINPWRDNFTLIGDSEKDYLVKGLSSNEVPIYLSSADCGLLLRKSDPVNTVSSPTKLGEYLASGVPVITTVFAGDSPSIISNSGCGYVLSEECPSDSEVDGLIEYIRESISICREDVTNDCIHTVTESHNWCETSKKLIDIYNIL